MTIFDKTPPILDPFAGGYPTLIYKRATLLSTNRRGRLRALKIVCVTVDKCTIF